MARNRKRAKERRSRRPTPTAGSRPVVATARAQREELEATPSPLEHATPDAELAEAQLALGRPDLASGPEPGEPAGDEDESSLSSELAASSASAPAHRGGPGSRLVNFLQGSWRELQRVQWPDRRQVMQATGVVIGFVIVAGVYLGVADDVAGKLVTLILK